MLSAESLKQIDTELAKYPADQRRSAIMGALRIAQTEKGWLAPENHRFCCRLYRHHACTSLRSRHFHNMYDLEPVGKYKLTVCTNLPCALRGGMATAEYLKQKLGIGYGETTLTASLPLRKCECMGACGDASLCWSNNHSMRQLYDRRSD